MKIINQDGTAIYNFNNSMGIKAIGKNIKMMFPFTVKVADGVQNRGQIVNVVLAEYQTVEEAKEEFEKLIARIAYGNVNVYQMPEKGRKE